MTSNVAIKKTIVIQSDIYVYTQLAKMSFDKIFDLTAGVDFNFYHIKTK